MRITVKVEGHTFEVEIESLDSYPIVAKVDNRIYEVTPEDLPNPSPNGIWVKPTYPLQEGSGNGNGKLIHGNERRKKTLPPNVISSPIPGIVIDLPNPSPNGIWVKPTYPLQEGSGNGNGKLIHGNGRRKKTLPPNVISSPIPGMVISIDIVENQEVQAGQVVCVIEAMKMKNFIRAPKSGVIRSIAVFSGQAVQANQAIAYYSE